MTESNQRRQPQQQRADVAVQDGGQEMSPQARALAIRKQRIAQVAAIVKESARDLERLLPEHIALPTFLSAAGAALWKSQDLMDGAISDPDAFMIALREAARLGHVPGTEHYWLTPRKVGSRKSVLGIEGYEGIVERMYRSGGVLSVHVGVVCENDLFEEWAGPNGRPLHKKAGGPFGRRTERGAIIGSYAYAMLPGGVPSDVVLLSLEDLMEAKAFAATPKLWNQFPVQMYKKTALRRLEPLVPVSAGYRQTQAQTTTFAAVAAPAAPLRMEDTSAPVAADEGNDTVLEGEVESPTDRPVTDVKFEPSEWGGDPSWDGLSVSRPGDGVPEGVRGDG